MELNTARVFVRDIESAEQFYSGKMGLAIKADGSQYGYCVFKAGRTDLVVETVADEAPEEERVMVGRFTGLSFSVQDVEAKHRELAVSRVPFTGVPEKQQRGGILKTLQDPAGNKLQIVQHHTAA